MAELFGWRAALSLKLRRARRFYFVIRSAILGANRRIMGEQVNGPWLTGLGWTATGVMTAAAVVFIAGSF